MKNFTNLLHKDFLLLIRDFWGVVLLFLMPWALVVMMTYLQDGTFRSVNENHIPLYLLNNDSDSLGVMVSRQILSSNIFEVSTDVKGQPLSEQAVEEAGADKTHEFIAKNPTETYKINCAVKPTMKSIVLELAD